MSSKKNVGRKRLGRIQISGGGGQNGAECGHPVNRPFQLQSKNTTDKQTEALRSNNSKDDLSFSNSFVCDLDADPDLMSALDKMEQDFGSGNTGLEGCKISKTRASHARIEHEKHKLNEKTDTEPGNRKQPESNTVTPTVQKNGRKRKPSRSSVIQLDISANMFDHLAWDSPVGVSTPVDPRPVRAVRSCKKSVDVISEKKTAVDNKEKENNSLRGSIKAKPQTTKDTPHRSTSKIKAKINLEDKAAGSSSKALSKNDTSGNTFFESLLLENDSMDISLNQNNKTGEVEKRETEVKRTKGNNTKVNRNEGNRTEESTCITKENRNTGHRSEENRAGANRNVGKGTEEKRKPNHTEGNMMSMSIQPSRLNVDTRQKSKEMHTADDHVLNSNASEYIEMVAKTGETRLKEAESVEKIREPASIGDPIQPTLFVKVNEMCQTVGKDDRGEGTRIQSDQLALSSWGLPDTVLKEYTQRGITHMFEWQAECLLTGNVLSGGNLVYSAPTSAGKTMVAELLVLKKVMETRKKAIIILPFVSVTREKMFYLQELYQDAGIRVSGFMGHYAPAGGFSSVDVAVCTIEKGNGLINRLLEENNLDKLGIIVVDELHLIGDPHRGYLLELLLTKISYMAKKRVKTVGDSDSANPIQIVGMSATLPNLDLLANWLNADLYKTDYRPVPLLECMKVGTAVYNSDMEIIRDVDLTYKVKGDPEHVIPLCIETLRDGHSVLIFCPTKDWCEKLSETIARELYNLLKNPEMATTVHSSDPNKMSGVLVLPLNPNALRDIVEQLRRTPVGLDNMLGRTVPYGVAYHHAGLTFDERDIVEGAFRQGILKVLVATSTLSSGVNLPARRVLIRTPVFYGGKVIDFLTYKQMIGRAGRKGVDTAGESILLCKPNEKSKAVELVTGELPPVKSTLIKNEGEELSSSMKRAILEVVVSGVAMETKDVASYAACTLLAASLPSGSAQTQKLIEQCISFLQENEFVCKQWITREDGTKTERFIPTQLGAAVLASSLSPDEGLAVFSELQRARQCFVLENELHIIYQVTPIYSGIGNYIDWYQFFCTWENLSPGMRKVAEIIGVKESFLAKSVRGRVPCKTVAQQVTHAIHKRFYTALVLHELVQEVPLSDVSRKFNCNKGQLQSLQQSAATFAGMVTVFCARLGWSNLELILSQFQSRLTFGVQRELCDLVRISTLNGQRARVLYKGGYQTVAALASAHPADVEALLKNSAPFQSSKKQGTETDWEVAERRKSRCIFLTGRKGVTEYEAAVIIIEEAKAMIQDELGGLGIQWNDVGNKKSKHEASPSVVTSPVSVQQRSFINQRSSSRKKKSPSSGLKRRASKQSDTSQPATKKKSCSPGGHPRSEQVHCVVSPPALTNKKLPDDVGQVSSNPFKVITKEVSVDLHQVNQNHVKPSSKIIVNQVKPAKEVNINKYHDKSIKEVNVDLNQVKTTKEDIIIEDRVDIISSESDKACVSKHVVHVDDSPKEKEFASSHSKLQNAIINKEAHTGLFPDSIAGNVDVQDTCTVTTKTDTGLHGVQSTSAASSVQCLKSSIMDVQAHSTKTTGLLSDRSKCVSNTDISEGGVSDTVSVIDERVRITISKDSKQGSSKGSTHNTLGNKNVDKGLGIQVPKSVDLDKHDNDVDDDDFLDTFVLDTQTANSIICGLNKVASVCKHIQTVTTQHDKDSKQNQPVDNDLNSEALFSESLDDASCDVDNHLIQTDKILNLEIKLHESMDNELELKLSESYESDKSCNDLEMNVFQNSNEDMFNNSDDIIAASNYERVGLSGETSVNNDRMNSSYEDLHIPYQSGQEVCFERCDNEMESNNCPAIVNACESSGSKERRQVIGDKIGLFSSPAPVEIHAKAQPDIADSFSSTFNMSEVDMDVLNEHGIAKCTETKASSHNKDKVKDKNEACGGLTSTKDFQKDNEQFGDSLTMSMIDMVLETSKSGASANCDKLINRDASQGTSSKQICDNIAHAKPDKTIKHVNAETIPVDQQSTVKNKNNLNSKLLEGKQFATPKGRAVKRARQTPNERNAKIAKTADSDHSTPEAQKKDEMRKFVSNNANSESEMNIETKKKGTNNLKMLDETGNGYNGNDSINGPNKKESKCQVYMKLQDNLDNKYKCSNSTNMPDKQNNRVNGSNLTNGQEKLAKDCTLRLGDVDEDRSPSVHNVSTGSDCVPVTPPGDDQLGATVTPKRTPLRSLNAMVYSPRLKSSTKKDQSELSIKRQDIRTDNNDHRGEEKIEDDDDIETSMVEDKEDKLSPSFIDPEESGLPLTQASFSIIDVCGDKRLFKTFIMEWRTKSRYAVSVACEKRPQQLVTGAGIGAKHRKDSSPVRQSTVQSDGIVLEGHDLMIVGVAVSWENRDAYYVSFTHQQPQGDPDDTLAAPPSDEDISIGIRIKAVKSVLQQAIYKEHAVSMVMFDVKAQYRVLAEGCGFVPKGHFEDPKIACWMLDPGARERTIHGMVTNLLPSEVHMLQGVGGGIGVGSLGLSPENPGSGRYRATTECVLVRHLGEYFQACLLKEGLNHVFSEVEMPAAISLCRMELNGFGFSLEESESQKSVMIAKLSALEEQAYTLAGHPFSLSATDDISQILYIELRLPPSGDPSSVKSLAPRGVGMGRGKSKPQYSTSKDVLEKLKKFHPLPGVILEWRRITNALTKVVFPLQKEKVKCTSLSMYRIYSECQLHSSTGRVSLSEPNLQNVPKDFEIVMPDMIGESPTSVPTTAVTRRTRGGSKLQQMIGQKQVAKVTDENCGTKFSISMRHAFVPFEGGVLLAADYSQLELRMIAYLSKDAKLISILNEDGDVFKLITAQWKNITPDEVTPEQRSQAKQVCYGMIYGIGPRALGEQLEVDENDAAAFIETFKAKYPGMRSYIRKTVEGCRENGYVQTMVGRKRYLQSITSTNPHARAQAERQAINTTVQGSAADLVKKAMIKIDQQLEERYPLSQYTQKHKLPSKHPARQKFPPDGAYLVLQLHDELIYEVNRGHMGEVANIVKNCMEHAMDLPVRMPVKIKTGESWGTLKDTEI